MKSVTSTAISLFILALIQTAMCATNTTTDPATYFSAINGNLTKIGWAHAVNNKTLLDRALSSADVLMLEADVVMGKVNGTDGPEVPVMAHSLNDTTDLSLENFLETVIKKNVTKGIKLDFKSIDAFSKSDAILQKTRSDRFKFPVFLNADILPGPNTDNSSIKPVDATLFLNQAKNYPECTLSVGWTTKFGVKENITEGQYKPEHVQSMIKALKDQNVNQSITYPIRAGLAVNSTEVIKDLIKNSTFGQVTLTVWSSEGDSVDPEKLSKLIKDVGVTKVYVDVPKDLQSKLRLMPSSASVSVASFTLATTLLITVLLRSTIL